MLSKLQSLLGLKNSSQIDKAEQLRKMEEELFKSVEDFKNRQIYSVLTEDIIKDTLDENLIQLIFDNLSIRHDKDSKTEFEDVLNWNKSRQAIYMIWLLESEVNNGGFNQFYFNSSGRFCLLLPSALKLIGAFRFAELIQEVNEIYEREKEKITKHFDGTFEGFSNSYKDNPLNDFDNKFYDLYKTENLGEIQINYIREHIEDFADN